MLLTNDGDLALRVTHPRYGIEKVYQARTLEQATSKHIQALMDGVDLEDGRARATRARIVSSYAGKSIIEMTMTEGRKREVRRMLEVIGLTVDQLVRVSIAGITDRTLAPGSYRALTMEEIRGIYKLAEDAS
jgi:23S rRNA pseudouridine2605 synthase